MLPPLLLVVLQRDHEWPFPRPVRPQIMLNRRDPHRSQGDAPGQKLFITTHGFPQVALCVLEIGGEHPRVHVGPAGLHRRKLRLIFSQHRKRRIGGNGGGGGRRRRCGGAAVPSRSGVGGGGADRGEGDNGRVGGAGPRHCGGAAVLSRGRVAGGGAGRWKGDNGRVDGAGNHDRIVCLN